MSRVPVLIVGAGPTGLVLALSLARRGVRFRLIDEDNGPGEHSRAMVVQARTLEFYRQFGFADEMVGQGIKTDAAHFNEISKNGSRREVVAVTFKDLGEGISPYPFLLDYPQDDHERFLVRKLAEAGISVEWSTKLTHFSQNEEQVDATLLRKDGRGERVQTDYICGCDGGHSVVRETLKIGFSGGTYEQRFFVADVKIAEGFHRDFLANLGEQLIAIMLPVRSTGMQRLIGLVPPELAEQEKLTFEDLRGFVEPLVNIHVTEVNWFSNYRVHHRVAEKFQVGRSFILGDAGHVHSPVGGQGMNTGIGDAINLGWKLAQVVEKRADRTLLDSYEPERIGFARALVSTTDRAFTPMIAEGWIGEFTRHILAPLFLTVGTRFAVTRHKLFRTLSQTHIHYENSPLSRGQAGHVHGGDRLPWVVTEEEDNFAPLRSLDWQVHVYGDASDDLQSVCQRLSLPLHVFAWNDKTQDAGFERTAVYLVRPDGYVGMAASEGAAKQLEVYANQLHLRFAA